MLKIIELEINPSLTADTGVFEVAWVEYPAIEQDLIFFGRQKFYKAPEEVSSKACKAIQENEKRGNPAATQVGKVRAQQLCNRDEISLETIKRMKSYLERAATYYTGDYDDNGTISYDLWGGKPALDWVDGILSKITEEKLAEVGPRGGIRESDKAPKSDTPNRNPKGEGTARGDASNTRDAEVTQRVEDILQKKSDEFNEKYKENLGYGVTVGMLKSVYQRGVGAYNTSHSPSVKSAEQWALARVNAFLYLVKNGRPENSKYTTDYDLLPGKHPKKEEMSMEYFVDPKAGETQDEYIGRCIPVLIGEGYEQDQATAICYSTWRDRFYMDKVSFDYDGTLTTKKGIDRLERELGYGNIIYLISARSRISDDMMRLASKYKIPSSHVYAVGSNPNKIEKVKELGIVRHYDDNPEVRNQLGSVGFDFDYVLNLPGYQNTSGDTMLIEPVLLNKDCGCSQKEEFSIIGYIDGAPIFSTPEEADIVAQGLRCGGHHEHVLEDGTVGYMPCEIHPEVEGVGEVDFSEYTPEQVEAFHLLKFLRENHREEFERVSSTFVGGMTYSEVISQNYKTPKRLYRYDRIDSGEPTRDFCDSIEGLYFDRFSIDQMRYVNTEFGHNKQPYSKWLYKGGPNCIHAWRPFEAKGRTLTALNIDLGQAGIPPKQMPNNGYYSAETKRKSEIAYIISQQNMSKDMKVELTGEFEPLYYADGFPVYDDLVTAQDVSYMLGCGGVTDQVEYGGRMVFQSCSTNMVKQDMKQTQMFASNEEKRMIYTPLMIPNILIPRIADDGERYFVKFTPETIEKIQQKFMIEQRLRSTNLEHTDKKFNDVVMVESWIVQGKQDKAYSLGFTEEQIPEGTWFGGFKVLDTPEGDMVWNKLIKPGKVKGASVEGNFLLNFSQEKVDEYLLSTIINILKTITD